MTDYVWAGGDRDLVTDIDRIQLGDTASIDAFGRFRVSEPETVFDSKQIFDNAPLIWDDAETSGSGTSSNHSTARASTTIGVSATTAGKRVRQTFRRFNYQPGKSLLILMTGVLGAGGAGINAAMGYFDDNNGIFTRCEDGVIQLVVRSSVTGSAVDNAVAQADWNLDKMDGNGPSGVTLDPSKAQIFFADMEWLGVGRVRTGFVVNGLFVPCHQFNHANIITSVYMSSANLPCRYEIENDGSGPATTLEHICCSVVSEGGQNPLGILRNSLSPALATLTTGTEYVALALRLKSTHLAATIDIERITALAASSNDRGAWSLRMNGTPSAALTFTGLTNSGVEVANGNGTITHSGGVKIDGGFFTDSSDSAVEAINALRLGASIAGTRDVLYLVIKPVTNNITAYAGLTWRELS